MKSAILKRSADRHVPDFGININQIRNNVSGSRNTGFTSSLTVKTLEATAYVADYAAFILKRISLTSREKLYDMRMKAGGADLVRRTHLVRRYGPNPS